MKSISRIIAVRLCAIIVILGLLTGGLFSYYLVQTDKQAYEENMARQADFIAGKIAIDLWTYNEPALDYMAAAAFQMSYIKALKIWDASGQFHLSSGKEQAQGTQVLRRNVVMKNEVIGAVEVAFAPFDSGPIWKRTLMTALTILLPVLLFSILQVFLVVRTLLSDPMGDLLQGIEDIADGAYSRDFSPGKGLEMKEIANSVKHLSGKLARREAAIRESEKRLQESLEKYRTLFNSFPLGITVSDSEGRIMETNQQAEQLLGVPKHEHEQRSLDGENWRIIRPDKTDMPPEEFASVIALREKRLVKNQELGILREKGNVVWLNVTATPLPLENYGVVVAYSDISEKKQLQENLLAHKNIVSATTDFISLVDRGYRYVIVNDSYLTLTQKTREELVGRTVAENVGEEVFESIVKPQIDRCLRGENARYQEWFEFAGGGRRFMDITYTPHREQGKITGVAVNGRDITELKRTQDSIRESEEKFYKAFHSSPVIKSISTLEEGRFLDANQLFLDMLEMEREDLIGQKAEDLALWQNMDRDLVIKELKQKGYAHNLPVDIITRSGKRVPVLWFGDVVRIQDQSCVIASGFDLTELKKSEDALRESESFLNILLDAIPVPVCYKNKEGFFLGFNKAYLDFFGQDIEQLAGKTVFDLYPPDAAELLHQKDIELFRDGGIQILEMQIATALDELRDIVFYRAVFKDRTGETAGLVGTILDITDRKQAQAERNRLETRLMQAQKMESIGTLAGGIAHDFNNILTPIVGISEMMLEDMTPDSQDRDSILEIHKAGKRGSDLVRQILAFSRQSEHEMIPIRLQKVIKEALKLSRSSIPSNIEILQDIQPDCGLVKADPTQIHQIAMNLITNAYHAVEESGGIIKVSLKEKPLFGDDLKEQDLLPGFYAELTVADNGCGIDPAIRDKIFDPYFTTKEKGKGTGLGLAVIHGIVKEHKGGVRIDSQPGKGAAITVSLPLHKDAEKVIEQPEQEPCPFGTERIMLVDDEAPVAKIQETTLTRLGYRVTTRIGSREALQTFQQNPQAFDLVMTDMNMPHMTGDQLALAILEIRPDIPIIICTGYSEKISPDRLDVLGVKGLIMKPAIKREVAQMVRRALDEAKV
ncbi:hybrid sensor histidine kinase/response regulator [Desulfatibacillum aliphaticivorans]|uniref:hybrid sensor histidine kinase/response regulator n=1 Tax=Desulfatibacillum aliphaticivorans TaxID=218208 RepID=UPI000411F2E8|nr:PAS domain S-box protein [Desulfatibacillum aliphaticivorans]